MKIEVIIPEEVMEVISTVGNITKQKSAKKIYNALMRKEKYSNKNGWFEVSSKYLHKINGRYKTIIDHFINNNILEVLHRTYSPGEQYGPTNIFETITKKSYSTKNGICLRYRFSPEIDLTQGETITIEFDNPNVDKRWYKTLKRSLESLGYDNKISRDGFGGRVYHTLIKDYKNELHKNGFCVIDAETSQPRLLYLILKERGLVDKKYNSIFENNEDFYYYLVNELNLKNRDEAKEVFMFWALGNGYTKNYNINSLFPVASKLLKTIKQNNYKDSSRYLSFRESRIFIDDLLNNIPTNFGIPIHDSLIIHQKDANIVMKYCQEKYPDLRFTINEL